MSNAWSSLTQRLEELQHLGGILGLLEWDQQTMMPSGSASLRGAQLATLSALHHEKLTDPQVGDWMTDVLAQAPRPPNAVPFGSCPEITNALHGSSQLIRALAEARSEGFSAWGSAANPRSSIFAPALNASSS